MTAATMVRRARASKCEALQRPSGVLDARTDGPAHADALGLPAEQIATCLVRLSEQDGVVVGFAVLLGRPAETCQRGQARVGRMRTVCTFS